MRILCNFLPLVFARVCYRGIPMDRCMDVHQCLVIVGIVMATLPLGHETQVSFPGP